MARYAQNLLSEETGAPVKNASVTVVNSGTDDLASLTDDSAAALDNPFKTDVTGGVVFNAADGFYDLTYRYAGELRRKDYSVPVGDVTPFLPKGDPGGNTMAIGLFTAAHTLTIANGTDLVQTSGHGVTGVGAARYAYDAVVDSAFVSTYPKFAFISDNGRGFRNDEKTITALMAGAVESTGDYNHGGLPSTYSTNIESHTDCIDALDAVVAWWFYRRGSVVADFRGRGFGISRPLVIDAAAGLNTLSTWDDRVYEYYGGRLVCLGTMDNAVQILNFGTKNRGQWDLSSWPVHTTSGTTDKMYYKPRTVRDGIYCKNIAGSHLGDIKALGFKRFAVKFEDENAGDNNNIPVTIGDLKAAACGACGTGLNQFNGTYASLTRVGGDSSFGQYQTIIATPASGLDIADLEQADIVQLGGGQPQTIVIPPTNNGDGTWTIRLFPWRPAATSGNFTATFGGGACIRNFNMANTTINRIEVETCGWALDCWSLFAPVINSMLADVSCGGIAALGFIDDSMNGLRISHYHGESLFINAFVDRGSQAVYSTLGTPSLMGPGSLGDAGEVGGLTVLSPGAVSGGVVKNPMLATALGVEMGGKLYSSSLPNSSITGVYNFLTMRNGRDYGSFNVETMAITLTADFSIATRFGAPYKYARARIYGAAANGAPTSAVTVQLNAAQQTAGITLNGGTSTITLRSNNGPIVVEAVFEPDSFTVGAGNWRVIATSFTDRPGTLEHGNADGTLTPGTSVRTHIWNAVLTADRAVTLATTNVADGQRFRIIRNASATGAFNLNIGTGPLKALGTAGTWADVEYDAVAAAWFLAASGAL